MLSITEGRVCDVSVLVDLSVAMCAKRARVISFSNTEKVDFFLLMHDRRRITSRRMRGRTDWA
jgi:hypothetical protein